MKRILLVFTVASLFSGKIVAEQDPVLMKINGNPVKKSEFEYLYHKNNTSAQQPLDDYLQLFIDYKLKVEEAKAQGLDTMQVFLSEFNGYKNQVTQPYLTDTVSEQTIAKKIYDRLGKNIEASHILIRFPQGKLLPKDTLEAYEKAMEIREKMYGQNAMRFVDAAAQYSEDPGARRSDRAGHLGWGTALMFVPDFEDAIYSTPVNEISMPIRSQFGYHIITVHNQRDDRGKVNASHIMLSYPQREPTQQEKDSIRQIAEEVYAKLLQGEDYAKLCEEYSTDRMTAVKGGNLGWIRSGIGIPDDFMDAAFAINEPGEFTAPVETMFGYHIIKLEDRAPRDSWEDMKEQIIKQVRASTLSDQVTLLKRNRLAEEVNYEINQDAYNKLMAISEDYFPTDSAFQANALSDNSTLLVVGNNVYTTGEFVEFLSKNANTRFYNVSTDLLENTFNNYVYNKLKDEYSDVLAEKNPDYRNLLKEYHDGILLFNIMNEEVWEKAANDSTGLADYFSKNKSKYTWENPKYKGHIIYCKDENTLETAKNLVNGSITDLNSHLKSSLNTDSTNVVFARRGVWGKGENKFVDYEVFGVEEEIEPLKDYPYFFVHGNLLNEPEEYTDVKGLVISDLQEQREKDWINALRKKHKVNIDKKILKTIN